MSSSLDDARADGRGDEGSIGAFPAKTEGLGAQVARPDRARRRHEAVRAHRRGHEVGGLAGQDRRGDGRTTAPSPARRIKVDPGDKVQIVLHNELPESTVDPLPRPADAELDGRHHRRHPGPGEARRDVHLRVRRAATPAVGMYHSHHDAVKQVPERPGRRDSSSATSRVPAGVDRHARSR